MIHQSQKRARRVGIVEALLAAASLFCAVDGFAAESVTVVPGSSGIVPLGSPAQLMSTLLDQPIANDDQFVWQISGAEERSLHDVPGGVLRILQNGERWTLVFNASRRFVQPFTTELIVAERESGFGVDEQARRVILFRPDESTTGDQALTIVTPKTPGTASDDQ